jgi:MtrB/PioB family decaheme-associated outer membrane protein
VVVEKQVSGTMKTQNRNFGLSISALLPALLLSAHGPIVQAQDTDPAIYSCAQCVGYTGWRGILDFGLGYVSDDSLRFGDYRGLEEEGFYAALDGDVHYRNLQGRYFDLYARDLGYDSRQLTMRGGNQDRYELRFGWQEIPQYRGYGTQTPFLGVGSDNLTLPPDWVYSSNTRGMTALESSLSAAFLKTRRKILDAGGTVKFARNWSFKADFQQQKKDGTRALGAGLYFNNSTILPAAIDYTTNQLDMSLAWSGKRGQVQLGFVGSYFDNGKTSMTWANPFASMPEHQAFRAAMEPDNEFYKFNLSGAFAVTPRIHLSGQAATGRLTQDDTFLPYTINPRYSDLPLPRSSLDGKLDTSTYNLSGKLFARLNHGFSFTARAKLDERDNKTPVDIYTQVSTDLFPTVNRYNRPYSYEREQYSADLRYRAHRVIRLSGGAVQNNMDRTLQAVERSEETTLWGEVKVNPVASTQVRFKLDSSNRDVSDYDQANDGSLPDHPLMRKYNQADRDRERAQIDLDFAPSEDFGINLSFFNAESEYTKSEVGLQESNDQSYSVNLNYAAGKKVNLYAFWTQDDIDAELINTPSTMANSWLGKTRDRITTLGLGLSARINEKSSVGFDYISADSKGDISVQTSNEEEPFSPLRTDLTNARVHYDHEINEHWGYKLYAEYEKYDSRDWIIDGLGVDGISSVLTMGDESPEYEVWYFRVQASYRF